MAILEKFTKSQSVMWGVVLISFGIGIYFYPDLPERFASHWGINGQVNGYMDKFWGVFLVPFISVLLLAFFYLLPKIDPLKANIEKFRKYFNDFFILILIFLFYVYVLTIAWNLGYRFDFMRLTLLALGVLFYYLGNLMKKIKRNWFIGIRTPWTLSSDIVWERTHKIGGMMFKISGIIAIVGIIFEKYSFLFAIVPITIASIYAIIYSCIEYKKEIKK